LISPSRETGLRDGNGSAMERGKRKKHPKDILRGTRERLGKTHEPVSRWGRRHASTKKREGRVVEATFLKQKEGTAWGAETRGVKSIAGMGDV